MYAISLLAVFNFMWVNNTFSPWQVNIWDAPSLAVTKEIPVPNTVLSVDTWTHYLAIGSTTVELFSMNDWEWKLTLTDHNQGTPRSEVCVYSTNSKMFCYSTFHICIVLL